MEEIDVPSYFLCPISLQIMRDPVTVSTGITYDRESIERWLFSCKKNTCPVTKQVLMATNLTPNHTLCRLIQAWCTVNSSLGIEPTPTPKPPVDKTQIIKIINDAKKSPSMQLKCVRRLRSITLQGERNRSCLESAGVAEFLARILKSHLIFANVNDDSELTEASDEALCILYHLNVSESYLKNITNNGNDFVESLVQALKHGNYQSRSYAIMLLKSIFQVADPIQLVSIKPEFFIEIVHVLRDQISQQSSKAALKLLAELCPWGRNGIKAVEVGAISVLIDLLLNVTEKRTCELILNSLGQLSRCAEGRSELLKHGAGLAVVAKKILRVSHAASDRAVRIISLICKYSATPMVLQEMLQVGVVSKLCLVLQVDTGLKTQDRAREILKLNYRVWRDSSCIPPHLLSSHPPS